MKPELGILLDCVKVAEGHRDISALRKLLADDFDWNVFVTMAVNHEVAGICAHALKATSDVVPKDIADAFDFYLDQTRGRNRYLLGELAQLLATLASRGIEAIPFKTAAVAMGIYGDFGPRTCGGLDFVVRGPDLASARAILRSLEYENINLQGDENSFHKKQTALTVRLHSRLNPEAAANADDLGLWTRTKPIVVKNQNVKSLSPEDHLVALAVDGTRHAWRRISMACDIAAVIHSHPDLDWSAVIERANAEQCSRSLLLAASVARRYLDAAIPESLVAAGRVDSTIGRTVGDIALDWFAEITKPKATPTERGFASSEIGASNPWQAEDPGVLLAEATQVLESDPNNVEARYAYAVSLRRLERDDDAIRAYQVLLDIEPNHSKALLDLARLLFFKQRNRESQSLFWRLLAVEPAHAEAHCGLGSVLRRLGQYGEAEAAYQQAFALRPNYCDALVGLGNVHLENGDLEAAKAAFTRAMSLAPDSPNVLCSVALCGKVRAGDPVIANLEGLLERESSMPSRAREHLHFGLAKAYEDTGDRARAFEHQLKGNAIHRKRASYDEARRMNLFEEIQRVFNADLFASARGLGDPSDTPVFIVGMPRSGSTLIEQILASHPKIYGAGERNTFPDCVDSVHQCLPPSWAFPKAEAILSPGLLRDLGSTYVEQVRALAPEAPRIVDKLLSNCRFVGLIHLALPNARILHAMRDPIDTCLSNFSRLYADNGQEFTYDLAELGRYYRAYQRLMAHWRSVLPPGVMLDVSYESVVHDFDTTARRIVAHCGLEWDDGCMSFHETKRPVNTASLVQVRQPLYKSSVGRWRPDPELLEPLITALAG